MSKLNAIAFTSFCIRVKINSITFTSAIVLSKMHATNPVDLKYNFHCVYVSTVRRLRPNQINFSTLGQV